MSLTPLKPDAIEATRNNILHSYGILDTEPERHFDDIARLVGRICNCPIALITFIDGDRQWFKAAIGTDICQTSRDIAFCDHTITVPEGYMVVPDTTQDARFVGNTLVTGPTHVRFYAGQAILSGEGVPLGSICVLDTQPHPDGLDDLQQETLRVFARQITNKLELRRRLIAERDAEASLRASEQHFRLIADTMPQMVWSTRPDGYHDYYNARWYEYTGASEDDSAGPGWNDILHPDDQDRAWKVWRHSLATGDDYHIEYRFRGRDGTYRWFLGRALPVRDINGTILRWYGTCTDIDDYKRAQAALMASEERLQFALNAVEGVGVWDWDVTRDIVYSDPSFSQLFGLTATQGHAGMPIETYTGAIHPDDRERVGKSIEHAMATGQLFDEDYRIQQKDGTVRWVTAVGRAHADENGKIARFPGVIIDITRHKQQTEALELLSRELGHRIKNIFAVVNSLVSSAFRGQPEAQATVRALQSRLLALARAHGYVRPQSPDHANRETASTLHGLLHELVAPYETDESQRRFVIEGTDEPIGVQAATALSLVIHEQATNAVKYGALSKPGGQVVLTGSHDTNVDGRAIYRLEWQEQGGPAITGVPERRGFGTDLAQRTVKGLLGGELTYDWHPHGLHLSLTLQRDRLGL